MSLTMKKRGLLWMLGIVTIAALAGLAWHQINTTLVRCFSFSF